VLAAVRGHRFDRTSFDRLFEDMADISVTVVDQPAAALLMTPDALAHFDAVLLYDMPGMDFHVPAEDRPRDVLPSEEFKTGFKAMLEAGIGVVALHHALAGWPAWPEYAELLGGRFLFRAREILGQKIEASGYAHDTSYRAQVVAPNHPVTQGLPAHFEVTDELYLIPVDECGVEPLLRCDHEFTRDNFWSASAAMDGKLRDRTDWHPGEGSNLIGWTKRALSSPLVYLQPGDGPSAYDNPHIRRLVENAIRWVASPEARAG
tara:strand:+ start:859 stop:1644 length:786 start_codon:yes stop_codon:yes gene_type:complete